ncbi:hypothetical protein [Cypionkella psychrotolerans]|uniref:hypothetical protein n=1 Tax=Cypionkella psychrotolerans TaxID=1678131 RepID=UPI0006B54042|nr:hypothetical protein [Cypionkella psychrotolerans]
MTQYPPVTAEQLEALAHLAKQNGRNWKAWLSDLWTRAADPTMHGLRNSHGPSWLSQFSLSLKL